MNNVLLIISIIGVFSSILIIKKLFGKEGLIGYMAIATILAEIGVVKSVNILGLSATLGNVLFASNFLVTDILTECYGEKEAKKGIKFAVFSVILFILIMQGMLLFVPSEIDFAQESMKTIFGLIPRISIASIVMLTISNFVDVKLYSWLKKKTNNKFIWLRNNISTILCNGTENFIFTFLCFTGIYDFSTMIAIATATTIIETIIAICDTPFLYISRKIK
jgi:hypothetical protein